MSGTELIMGMEEVVQHIRELEKQKNQLEEENKKLKYDLYVMNDIAEERGSHMEALDEERVRLESQNKQLQEEINHKNKAFAEWCEENKKLQEEIKEFQEEAENQCDQDPTPEEARLLETMRKGFMGEITKLKEEIRELEMKGNARKDIIKNMFECITADIEEVQDGFYIKRDWGNKCIDKWNEIVSQEYQDALKDINEQLEGIEWVTDGYQFDLNMVDEEDSDSDEEEEQDSCEVIAGFFPVRKGSHIHHNLSGQRFTLGDRMRTTYKDEVADNSLMRRICVLDDNDKISKKNVLAASAFAIFTRGGDDEMYYICRNNNNRGALQVRNIINNEKVDFPIPPEFLKDLQRASRPLDDNMTRVSAILKGGGFAIVDVAGPILYKDFPDWLKGKTGEEVGEYMII